MEILFTIKFYIFCEMWKFMNFTVFLCLQVFCYLSYSTKTHIAKVFSSCLMITVCLNDIYNTSNQWVKPSKV